jgi:glycine/D-amino acid oxidase-like deaminating enzyme
MSSDLCRDPGLPVKDPTPSYWQQTPSTSFSINDEQPPAQRDIVIIGSGITAASVAWHLLTQSPELNVTVVEARGVCSGATGRNGGRINATAVQDFSKYTKIFGREHAMQIVRFELAHYQQILDLVKSVGPELEEKSEIRWIDALLAVFEDDQLNELRRMLALFETFFPDLRSKWRIVEKQEVNTNYGIGNAVGGLLGKAGAAWPYRMVTGIFEHLKNKFPSRFWIHEHCPVLNVSRRDDHTHAYTIDTSNGGIRAKHVIYCTEGHTAHLVPKFRGILVPRRGQMTVQNPGKDFPKHKLQSWSFYMQGVFDYSTANAKTGEIFIGGGEPENRKYSAGVSSDAENELGALAHLDGVLPTALGSQNWGSDQIGKPRVNAAWTGIMGFSLDHAPFVGPIPEALLDRPTGTSESREWISAGYGGYGMVNAFLCGKALALMVLGKNQVDLPKPYFLTEQRAEALLKELKRVRGSNEEHIKALL